MWKQTLSNLVKGVSNFAKANPPVDHVTPISGYRARI